MLPLRGRFAPSLYRVALKVSFARALSTAARLVSQAAIRAGFCRSESASD